MAKDCKKNALFLNIINLLILYQKIFKSSERPIKAAILNPILQKIHKGAI